MNLLKAGLTIRGLIAGATAMMQKQCESLRLFSTSDPGGVDGMPGGHIPGNAGRGREKGFSVPSHLW